MPDSLAVQLRNRVESEFGSVVPPDDRFYEAVGETVLSYIAANAIFTFTIGGVTTGAGVTSIGTIQVSFPPQT